MNTLRLTTAQAIVRYLVAQRTVIDGREEPLFAGVFAIFGHGNVTGLGFALDEVRDVLPTIRGQNEQGMALAVFESGARGTFESSRTLVGPESQMAFDLYGTEGALSWNLERMNELRLYLAGDEPYTGYTTVFAGDRFPYHGNFVPGRANGIGFEDLIAIEDYEFLGAVARGEPFRPGFEDALAYVAFQSALVRSWESGAWETVVPVAEVAA